MGRFVRGDIVIIRFPFSDLTGYKKRPALVIAEMEGSDIILCQITSKLFKDKYTVELKKDNFSSGQLIQPISSIRPNRLFTTDSNIVLRKVAKANEQIMLQVKDVIVKLLQKQVGGMALRHINLD